MYSVKVTEIGTAVRALMRERIIILFGPAAPIELRDICVIHDGAPVAGDVIKRGGTIAFGNHAYKIVEVGDAANENFISLGHLTINFSKDAGILPGSIRVGIEEAPEISVGDTIVCL
ncbi:PTS glucitol/sorbitol transporter subunit IIA [Olsenella uli]|uniref:PTS glucitol/sorbitol transporter subunit IIA n=1 Tax=Olsenella uli TaxID=133926 RepID=UPI0028F0C47E|nr:PTS glucitol/sorbitol transporter subunit IIA [Olsenella uli]